MSEKPRFHYKIKEKYALLKDGICCQETFDNWHFYRCENKVKEIIDGIGLCGIHAKSLRRWRAK